ncbi:hypothetical protein OH77DRAFT_1497955 [Trametes cingulata]|nr:hypothetical protein OH77DRAFT_1497955 [Trametes cingulata]
MSDLDADLYGDLYGNDENEFAVPTTEQPEQPPAKESSEQAKEEQQAPQPREPSQEPSQATTTAKPSSVPQSEDTRTPPSQSNQPSDANAIPSYMSPPTQQIPTYEERQPTDLREPPPPRVDPGYQGVPGVDRPVRPSEMKEEG